MGGPLDKGTADRWSKRCSWRPSGGRGAVGGAQISSVTMEMAERSSREKRRSKYSGSVAIPERK
jgi:hypothetical protein